MSPNQNALVVLTSTNELVAIAYPEKGKGPRPLPLSPLHLISKNDETQEDVRVTAMEVLVENGAMHVLVATSDATLYVVNRDRCEDKCLNTRLNLSAPIVSVAAAPNGHFVACFTKNGRLKV